jgi:hypothetical protein
MQESEEQFIWSGTLFSASMPLTLEWRVPPPSNLFADQSTLLQADVFTAATRAKAYEVEVYLPAVTAGQMRDSGTGYPEEIRDLYLYLPSSVPDRVLDLALDIADAQSNPYDKAKAIETYLRAYPYDLNVPAPPPNRDVADYFLFDLKKGYCDYYATTMVVLARANGIPARFVSGYAPGVYDAPNAQYIVREMDAHSWAEIYFPEIGWIEFEPTASQPEIERLQEIPLSPLDSPEQNAALQLLTRFRMEQILYWSSPFAIILLFALVYFIWIERWLILRHAPDIAIDRIQQAFYRSARPLAGTWTSAETSTEFLKKLNNTLDRFNTRPRLSKLATKIRSNSTELTSIYHATLFTSHTAKKLDAVSTWKTWKQLRRELFIMKMFLRKKK